MERARVSQPLRKLGFGLTTAAGGLLLIGAAAQTPESRKLEMLGICSYDSSKLNCWKPNGRRDAELTKRLDRALRTRTEYSFQYRFGMKNRLLVFEQSGRGYTTFSTPGDNYLNAFDLRNDGLGPATKLIPIAADADRNTGNISAVLQTGDPAGSTAAPLKIGQELTLGPVRVVVGPPQLQMLGSSAPPGAPQPPRRSYTYPLTMTSPPGTVVELQATAYDLKGNLIEHVDSDGKPIPLPATTPNEGRGFNFGYGGPLGVGRTSDNAGSMFSTIDPAQIGEIRWSATLNRRYEFRDFALDPRR